MSDTLSSEIKASLGWLFQDSLNLGTVVDSSLLEYRQLLADGMLADQADKIWHDARTLPAGASEDLVLSALPLSLFGDSVVIALANVRAILLINTATTAGEDLVVGGATSREWRGPLVASGDRLIVPADSCLLVVNKKSGWPVVAGLSDKLRVSNSGSGDITYKIAILGTSA